MDTLLIFLQDFTFVLNIVNSDISFSAVDMSSTIKQFNKKRQTDQIKD